MVGVTRVSRRFHHLPLLVLSARFEPYHCFVVGSSSTSLVLPFVRSLSSDTSLSLRSPPNSVSDRLSRMNTSGSGSSSSNNNSRLFAEPSSSAINLEFVTSLDENNNNNNNNDQYDSSVIIGRKEDLESLLLEKNDFLSGALQLEVAGCIQKCMMESLDMKKGGSVSSYVSSSSSGEAHNLSICALPSNASRNNHPMAVHTLTSYVQSSCKKGQNTRVIMVTPKSQSVAPLASAIAKAFPAFSKKTNSDNDPTKKKKKKRVSVVFVEPDEARPVTDSQAIKAAQAVSEGVILAARLVDSHPELMTSDQMAQECQAVVDQFPQGTIHMTQIVGEQLNERGYGGLYGVGKAATCPPRLIIMEYNGAPDDDGDDDDTNSDAIALVGKGIIYDTGGLSIKPKTGMCGMKADMGGAAGLLGGFYAAVKCQTPKNIKLLLCVAENAIGPTAFRNDDILQMYSGKTVEVNNCDAEGRLVLADGVAHVTQHMPDVTFIVDMATLTGAQMVATGKKHAAILANTQQAEQRAFHAGMHSGDLCFPLLYAPELLMDEFKSEVADMKNSVKDRGNAQTSCAGHFIESHLAQHYHGDWLHIDMAGPSTKGERATGYGVGLVMALLNAPGF